MIIYQVEKFIENWIFESWGGGIGRRTGLKIL